MAYTTEEDIYEVLSKTINIKFKRQLDNSGICFEKFYKLTDLVSEEESYLLKANGKGIRFKNQQEFIQEFILFIQNSISELNERYKELQEIEQQPFVDEQQMYYEHETIGLHGEKQLKLLKKIRSFGIKK